MSKLKFWGKAIICFLILSLSCPFLSIGAYTQTTSTTTTTQSPTLTSTATSTPTATQSPTPMETISLDDVPSDYWASTAILTLVEEGIIAGYPDGTFKPENPVTRAEFAKMALLALGLKEEDPENPTFSDVSKGHWAYSYIEGAVKAGLIKGYPDGSFKPEGQVTKAEEMTVIVRAQGWNTETPSQFHFADCLEDDWFTVYVETALAQGVVMIPDPYIVSSEDDAPKFDPNSPATRAQTAVFLWRMSGELPALIPYRVGDKWGYCDRDKKIVIQPAYDEVNFFSEGLASVRLNGEWGYIDSEGTLVIDTIYINAYLFNEGLALVCDRNSNYSFIDAKGNVVIPSKDASYTLSPPIVGTDWRGDETGITSFRDAEGLWKVLINEKNWGFIDKSGKLVIELPEEYGNVWNFKEGLAYIQKDNKYGFIDKTGKIVIPVIYDDARPFSGGLAAVAFLGERGYKWGFVDKAGELVIPAIYDNIYPPMPLIYYFKENLCPVRLNGEFGFIDDKGNFVIPPKYDWAYPFCEGLALVQLNGKYGFIDKAGNVVIPFSYSGASSFSDGLARVRKEMDSPWGFIDKTGKEVIPMIYRPASNFRNGLALVYMYKRLTPAGYIDKKGNQYWED